MKQRDLRSCRGGIMRMLIVILAVGLLVAIGFWVFFFVYLKPDNLIRQEIYRGVYLTVEDIPGQYGKGKVMIAEIHWDEPGVELYFRPFRPRNSGEMHYTLMPADYLMRDADLDLMINTTRYYPEEWWKCFPGKQVNSLETLVWNGRVSHIHRHSYMFGWNEKEEFLYEATKPPSPAFLDQLKWGIGVQSITLNEGMIREAALGKNVVRDARTFLAVDPDEKILWLIVGERISELGINMIALRQGAIIGSQLDTQDASNMVIGSGARGVKSMTGIRGRRMLAATLGIRAEPIPEI